VGHLRRVPGGIAGVTPSRKNRGSDRSERKFAKQHTEKKKKKKKRKRKKEKKKYTPGPRPGVLENW